MPTSTVITAHNVRGLVICEDWISWDQLDAVYRWRPRVFVQPSN